MPRHRSLLKKLQVLAKSMMFLLFHELSHFLQPFAEKFIETPKHGSLFEKPSIWPKLCNFSSKQPCLCISMDFSGKSCKKCLISWKSTKDHQFSENFATFRANYLVFAFLWTFQQKVAKSASFGEKAREIIDLGKTIQLFKQTTMFLHFDELLRERWEKVVNFVKKHKHSWIWSKLATFRENYHVLTFQQKVAKPASFREKARKLIDLAKTMQLFRTNYHVLVFRWTFQPKVDKSGSIHEKARKVIDLAKTCIFSSKLPCLGIFMNFSARRCKKCLISWKRRGNDRYGQNYATFRTNYHVFAFRWTFQKKVAKSASVREKARKTIDLAKTMQLFLTNYQGVGLGLGLTLTLTTMFWRFDELFSEKLQKLPHFVKKHKNSSIWPKLCNFYEQTTMFWCFDELLSKRLQKVAQFVKNHEKSSIWPKLWEFSNKLPCLCISMNFSGKSCKRCLISWKNTKNHRFGQNLQLFEQTTMSWHFHELFSKKLQKAPHSVEKHEKSSIWPKLCNFFEQTTMSLHFDQLFGKKLQKVPHFVKQHEKSLIWPKLCNSWNKLQCLFPFDELSRKKIIDYS